MSHKFSKWLGSVGYNPNVYIYIWVFPKIGVPQNGWFLMDNHIKMDDLGVPLFSETSIYIPFIYRLEAIYKSLILTSWHILVVGESSFQVPEGSYATDPDGLCRILEHRRMVTGEFPGRLEQ